MDKMLSVINVSLNDFIREHYRSKENCRKIKNAYKEMEEGFKSYKEKVNKAE